MTPGRVGNTRTVTGAARTRMTAWVGWLVMAMLFCFTTPALAVDMIGNGGFDGATSWTFGGNGSYSTLQNNGSLTGAGSFLSTATGRKASLSGTASQTVSIIAGAQINSVSLAAMSEWVSVASDPVTVTVDIRYSDATTANIFSGTLAAGQSWTNVTNDVAGTLPLTAALNVSTVIVTATSKAGNDAAAGVSVYVDDIVVDYTASLTDTLTVTSSTNVSTTAQPGQADVQMMYMQLNSNATGNGNCVVTDVTLNDPYVSAVGTIANVQVHIDDDNNILNGSLGFNTTGAWDGSSTVVDLTGISAANRTVYQGTAKYIWLLYDIDAGSATGIQSQLQVTDVGVVSPDIPPSSGPWDSNIIDINTGLGCGGCHPNPMVDGVARDPLTGGVEGDHTKHASAQGYECTLCHLAVAEIPRHRDTFITMTETIGTITNATYTTTGKTGVIYNAGVSVQWPQATVPVRGNCQNTNCHGGISSVGYYGGPTGTGPQWGTTNNDTCTFCHNANQTNSGGLANAYPSSASPFRSNTDVGAHAVHLTGTSSLVNGGVACADCHTVPAAITDPGHMDELAVPPYTQAPADVPLPGAKAALNSTSPVYYNSTMTCDVYCHGSNMPLGDDTGSNISVVWSDDWANYSGGGCTAACHGLPPKTGSSSSTGAHAGVTAGDVTSCNGCHSDTTTDTGNPPTINVANHINGSVESTGCTGCHGTDPKQYPPVSPASGGSDGLGAHVAHIESSSGIISKETIEGTLVNDWCAECHTTTRGATNHDTDGYPAEVAFTDAVESVYGSTSASISPDDGVSVSDNNAGDCTVYCHGANMPGGDDTGTNQIPDWADNWTNYPSGCSDSCHALPPKTGSSTSTSSHAGVTAGDVTACKTCHGSTTTDTGNPPTLDPAFHINGTVEATGCTGCHGTDPKEYPPVSPATGGPDGLGAHVAHIENTSSMFSKEAIGGEADLTGYWCAECHTTTRGANGHDDAYPAEVAFTNAVDSKYGSVTASFTAASGGSSGSSDGTAGTCTTYCHGANMPSGDDTGTKRPPQWADDWTNYPAGCTDACHGLPPKTGSSTSTTSHSGVTAGDLTACNQCHPDTTTDTSNPPTMSTVYHINGTLEANADCTACHNGGGTKGTSSWYAVVSASSPHSNNATGMICEDCHFAGHTTRTSGTFGIDWYATTMGTDYTADAKVYIKKYLGSETTEAEICWNCHEAQNPDVSEWDGTNATYDYGYVTTNDLNWFTTTWESAIFSYKGGGLTTAINSNGASTHGTIGGADGVDTAAEIGCTRCHDVHGIDHNGTSTTSAPYLRGSWESNPFPEDGAPRDGDAIGNATDTYTGDTGRGKAPRSANIGYRDSTGAGTASTAENTYGGWQIEQNNGGRYTTAIADFAGLCFKCHVDGSTIESGTTWTGHNAVVPGFGGSDGESNIFKTSIRRDLSSGFNDWRHADISHMGSDEAGQDGTTYLGGLRTGADTGGNSWVTGIGPDAGKPTTEGYTHVQTAMPDNPSGAGALNSAWNLIVDDGTTQSGFHQFPCSKCHNPHASRLPKLMITNCLDVQNNSWDGAVSGDPSTWNTGNGAVYNAKELAYSPTAANCHRYVRSADGNKENGAEAGWNPTTPWDSPAPTR